MNKSIFFLLFIISTSSYGQDKHRTEFGLSAIGNIHYATNKSLRFLNEVGGNYQRYAFEQTYIVFGLQGMSMKYGENSKDTLNLYKGELKYTHWQANIGVRHYFREEIQGTMNYFAEGSFHYSRLNSLGTFSGGQFGSAFFRDNRFKGVGFGIKAGAVYQSFENWYVGANVATYLTGGRKAEVSEFNEMPEIPAELDDFNTNQTLNRFQFELRVGFRFLPQ